MLLLTGNFSTTSKFNHSNIQLTILAGMGWALNVGQSFLGMSGLAIINTTGLVINDPVAPKLEQLLMNATISAIGLTNATTPAPIRIHQWESYYAYSHSVRLFASYGISLIIAIVAVGLGFMAMAANKFSAGRGFFQILITTRNRELDGLSNGGLQRTELNVPDALKQAKLRYGRAWDGSHTCFGTERSLLHQEGRG